MEQKIAFIKKVSELGAGGFAALCRELGISRKTGYKWRGRFRQTGDMIALQDRSRRPQQSRRIDSTLVEQILQLRQPDGWGARKIACLLWEKGQRVSVATVHRTLLRQGAVHRLDQHAPALGDLEPGTSP